MRDKKHMPIPRKVNVKKALKAKLAGQSYQEIADSQGVSKITVYNHLKPLLVELPAAEELAQIKRDTADLFAVTAYRSLANITNDKLSNASPKDLALIAGITTDKHRLITGQSTNNVSIMLKAVMEADDGE